MFEAIGSVLGWIFQAIVSTVIVDWVSNYLRRRREQSEAANNRVVTVEKVEKIEKQSPPR